MSVLLFGNSLDSYIFEQLACGPLDSRTLLHRALTAGHSRSGTYRSIAKLKDEGVLNIKQKMIALHPHVVEKVKKAANTIESAILHPTYPFDPRHLHEGESQTFTFKNFHDFLRTWDCYYAFCIRHVAPTETCFTYQDYDWMTLVNFQFEDLSNNLTETINRHRIDFISETNLISKNIKSSFYSNFKNIVYDFAPALSETRPGYYFNIFGTFILEAWLEEPLALDVAYLFNNSENLELSSKDLAKLIHNYPGKYKFRVQNNFKKALLLKNRFGKYFYIPNT